MKQLLLIRHAEAVGYADGGDFARPLSDNGQKEAVKTAKYLEANNLLPEHTICSPALRTATTAKLITEYLHLAPALANENIYEASEQILLKAINACSNQYNFIALIGHNPGISYLLSYLTGDIRDVPPATAIAVQFDLEEWAAISNNTGTITHYFAPQFKA